MGRTLVCSAVIVAALASVGSQSGRACGFHGLIGDGFSGQYPGSISVAIALRDAADAGVIDPAFLAQKKADLFAYHRAVRRLEKLKDVFAKSDVARLPTFSLLLVESALWSRYSTGEGTMSVAVHTDGPRAGEAVVLTGEAVIAAIEAGKLSWQDAIQQELIVIVSGEGDVNASSRSRRG